jgi:hypothetical protein
MQLVTVCPRCGGSVVLELWLQALDRDRAAPESVTVRALIEREDHVGGDCR